MPKMTLQQARDRRAAACTRYAAAAREFRTSMAELGALDQMLANRGDHAQGFGEHVPATMLRHSVALPDESGSIGTDIMQIIETTQIEG